MTDLREEINPLDYADQALTIPQIATATETLHTHLALRFNQVRNNVIADKSNPAPLALLAEAFVSLSECVKKLNLAIKIEEAEE